MAATLSSLVERCRGYLREVGELPSEDEARKVGDRIGVDWSKISIAEFRMGLAVEMEHGSANSRTDITHDDLVSTGKIALAHLSELPDYYTKLQAVEPDIAKLKAALPRAESKGASRGGLNETMEPVIFLALRSVEKHLSDELTRRARNYTGNTKTWGKVEVAPIGLKARVWLELDAESTASEAAELAHILLGPKATIGPHKLKSNVWVAVMYLQ